MTEWSTPTLIPTLSGFFSKNTPTASGIDLTRPLFSSTETEEQKKKAGKFSYRALVIFLLQNKTSRMHMLWYWTDDHLILNDHCPGSIISFHMWLSMLLRLDVKQRQDHTTFFLSWSFMHCLRSREVRALVSDDKCMCLQTSPQSDFMPPMIPTLVK
jgi:hypothetical protein